MDEDNSITLINQLCESFFPPETILSTKGTLKKLQTQIISQLFAQTFRTNTPENDLNEPSSVLKTDILCQALKNKNSLTDQNEYANKLYDKVDEIIHESDPDISKNIFSFLHELSKSAEIKTTAQKVNKNPYKIPINHNNKLFSEIIKYEGMDWSVFHEDPVSISNSCFDYPFYEEPGKGISFFKEHIAEFKLPTSDSAALFDTNYKIWRFDLNKHVEPVVLDEGFVTPGSEFSGGESIKDEESESQFSDKLSELNLSDYESNVPIKRSWDRLGNEDAFHELPFSSESVNSIIHFWKLSNSNPNARSRCFPIGEQVTLEELMTDLGYLLLGIASPSFYFNQEIKLFEVRDKLHTSTLSPEILADYCKDMLQCANYYYSLKTFAEERLRKAYGSIHYTFCKCVQQILNMYRYCLLKIEWQNIKYLSNLQTLIVPLERKLSFLAKFCLISISEPGSGLKFPSGAQLLDYLYSNLSKVNSTELGYLLFYIFEACCNAYFRIISEWIFEGCFSNPDNYAEFFIEIRREYEICRDWRRVSCIGIREKKIPKFLDKFYKEIFVCGKSINLLKICSSKEILDNLVEKDHPNLLCCFNQNQMTKYIEKWQTYKISYEGHFRGTLKIRNKLLKKCDNPDFQVDLKRFKEIQCGVPEEKICEPEEDKLTSITSKDEQRPNNLSNELKNADSNPDTTNDESTEKKIEQEPNPETSSGSQTSNKHQKIIIGFASSENPTNEESPDSESKKENISTNLNLSQGGGDHENVRVKHLVSLLEHRSQPSDKITPNKLPRKSYGAGDAPCSPSTTEVLKDIGNVAQSEYLKNKLKSSSSLINSPLEPKSPAKKSDKSTPLSACQINKLKITSSEYHNRLNDSLNSSQNETPVSSKPKILSAAQENKLKVMSSEYHTRLSMTNTPQESTKQPKPKLSICDQNKLKVMTSEYHVRLNESLNNSHQKTDGKNDTEKPAVLSALQENKLKVMSSEYHVRLNESLDTSTDNKVHSDKPAVLSALQENKLKVMSSEYHVRLNDSLSASNQKSDSNEPEKPPVLTAMQENKLKVMSSEYHTRLSTPGSSQQIRTQCRKTMTPSDENKLKVMSSEYHIRLQNPSSQEDQKTEPSELTECQRNKLKVMKSEYHHDLETQAKHDKEMQMPKPNNLSRITEEGDTCNTNSATELDPQNCQLLKKVHFRDLKNTSISSAFNFPNHLENFTLQSIESVDITSVSDVDITSLAYYLAQSIAVPLRIQTKLVNEAILRVFIEEECYLDHLTSLRDYLLLRKPEFVVSLTSSIFKRIEKVKKPYLLLNNYTLSSILQRALLASATKESIVYGRRLSFVADDIVPETFTLIDIKELDCVSLNYSIKWPINILITEPIVKKYAKISKFLMQIHRVLWVLKRDFISLKNQKLGKSIQYTKIQLFRHNMTQVVKIVQDYVMREALETCWINFIEDLTTNEIDLDELYMSHLKYINKTIQRCFLCDLSAPCREAIADMFSVILKYHEALKAGVWRRNVELNFLYHTNFKNIDVIYVEFVKNLNLVRSCLKDLVYNKQKTYFETLYLELSKNSEPEV